MDLTEEVPDAYEELAPEKKAKVEAVLKNLYHGGTLKDACRNANIGYVTFYRYRRRYTWVAEAVEVVMESRVQLVEDSLFRAAIGYEYEVTEQQIAETVDQQGDRVGNAQRRAVKRQVNVPPNPTAMVFYLKNRARNKYKGDMALRDADNLGEGTAARGAIEDRQRIRERIGDMPTEQLEKIAEMGRLLADEGDQAIEARARAVDDATG